MSFVFWLLLFYFCFYFLESTKQSGFNSGFSEDFSNHLSMHTTRFLSMKEVKLSSLFLLYIELEEHEE